MVDGEWWDGHLARPCSSVHYVRLLRAFAAFANNPIVACHEQVSNANASNGGEGGIRTLGTSPPYK